MDINEARSLSIDISLHFFHRLTEFESANNPEAFADKASYVRALWAFIMEKDKDLVAPTKPSEWGTESREKVERKLERGLNASSVPSGGRSLR